MNHTIYVTRESQNFLSKLLIFECHDKSLCEEIILNVTEPLVKATSNDETNVSNISFGKFSRKI